MAITKTIEIDVIAPNAQQNINAVTSSLNNASKSSDNLNKNLNSDKGASKFTGLKDAIGGIVPSFDKASNGASAFNKQLLVLLANPIGLAIAAIVLAVAGLVAIFKGFTPVVDKVEQGLAALSAVATTIKNTFIAVVTGTKSLGDAFSGLGGSMSDAANEAIRLTKAQQDLDDALDKQAITTSRLDSQINKLNVQAKNRNLTEAESLALLEKSENLQKLKLKNDIELADKAVKIARDRIANAANLTKEERKQLKEQGFDYKEFVEGRTTDVDELFEALKSAQIKRNNVEDQATAQLEKNQNKQDAIADKAQAKRDKAIEDEKARREKLKQSKQKEIDDAIKAEEARKTNQENLLKELDELVTYDEEAQQRKDERSKANQDLLLQELESQIAYEDRARAEAEKTAEQKKILQQQEIQAASDTFGILSDLLGKQSKAGKAFAVAQALINTYQGITAGVKLGYPAAIPAVIAASVTGFKAVKDILKTDPKAGGGGSASASGGGGGTPTATPQFNLVGQSSTNQLAQTISSQQKQPIKTYVVAGDVTTQQSLDRNAVQTSTFGG